MNDPFEQAKPVNTIPLRPLPGGKGAVPEPKRDSRFFSAADLKGRPVPERDWIVPDLIPMKTVTLFSGDGGAGKSLLALQLAVAVTAETDWIGRGVSTPGRVIYMSAEDDEDELHRRLADILTGTGAAWDDLSGLTLRSLAGEDALLAFDNQLSLLETELFKELERRADDDLPALIVIDTLADVYPANENDRAKVRQFIGILRGLALRKNCAVVLLSHPSLSGMSNGSGISGSTAWNNSVRSRLYLTRITDDGFEPDPNARLLKVMKSNYAGTGGEIALNWRNGLFEVEARETGLDRMAASAKAQRVFLKLLDTYAERGMKASPNKSSAYAPTLFAKEKGAEGCKRIMLEAAMRDLLDNGQIAIEEHGPPSNRRQYLVRKEALSDG